MILLTDKERSDTINAIPESQWGCGNCSEKLTKAQLKKVRSLISEDMHRQLDYDVGGIQYIPLVMAKSDWQALLKEIK